MLGQKLKELRKNRNLKQDDIALLFGISKGSISNWENERRSPNIQQLQTLAEFYGVSMDYFKENHEEKTNVNEVLTKAKNLLVDSRVSIEDKEKLFNEIMMLYLSIKNK